MERKITRIGNSLGVSMTEALREIGLKAGDHVQVIVKRDTDEIVIKRSKTKVELPDNFDPRFFEALNFTLSNYDETLKGLKDR